MAEGETLFDNFGDIMDLMEGDIEINDNNGNVQDIPKQSTTDTPVAERVEPTNDNTQLSDDTIDLDKYKDTEDTTKTTDSTTADDNIGDTPKLEDDTPSSPSEDTGDSSPSSDSVFLAFAKLASKEGVFDNVTDEEWSNLVEETGSEVSALIALQDKVINEELTKREQDYINSLTDDDKAIYEAKRKGVPLDKFGEIQRSKKQFSSITDEQLSNEETQKLVVTKDLELKGYEEEDIKDMIESLEDSDKLGKAAKSALKRVNSHYTTEENKLIQEREKEAEQVKAQREQQLNNMKSLVESTEEIVPGLKLNKKSKQAIIDSMTIPVAQDNQGNYLNSVMTTRAKNPLAFETALHYYHSLGLFNIDEKSGSLKPDFSKILNKAANKATDEFKKALESTPNLKGGSPQVEPSKDKFSDEFSKAMKNFDKYIR